MQRDQDEAVTRPKIESGPEDMPKGATSLTVYFDGTCPLCTAEISHYAAQRGGERLDFVEVSRDETVIGANLAPRDAMRRFYVRRPESPLLSGARAFVAIWDAHSGSITRDGMRRIELLSRLFRNDQDGQIPRREAVPEGQQHVEGGARDLRSKDLSSKRDRSAHRRSTWLYEDLLH